MNYYEILEIETDSSPLEIERKYQKLMADYFNRDIPDIQYEKDIQSVQIAYSILINPKKRKKYDKKIQIGQKSFQNRIWGIGREPIKYPTPYRKGDPIDFSDPTEYSKSNPILLNKLVFLWLFLLSILIASVIIVFT